MSSEQNDIDSKNNTTFESWDDEDLNLKTELLRGVYAYGFENPSPIQKQAIKPLIQRRDNDCASSIRNW